MIILRGLRDIVAPDEQAVTESFRRPRWNDAAVCRLARAVLLTIVCVGSHAVSVLAQGALPTTADKTGTNPLNIQTTVAVFNEFRSLPDARFSNVSRYRTVWPLAGRRMSANLDVPIVVSNVTGRTEAAFGDLGMGWTWVPWIQASSGVRTGVDVSASTATNDALGNGRPTIAPFLQAVFFPTTTVLFGVGYTHQRSVGGDSRQLSISEGTAALYLAWLPTRTTWVIAEPQIAVDHQRDEAAGAVDVEWGQVLFGGRHLYSIGAGDGIGEGPAV